MKEWTSGNVGILVFKGLLLVAADDAGIRVCGFRIPFRFIDKLISDRSWPLFGAKCLRIVHHHPVFPKSLCFVSSDASRWYETFEKKRIETEDQYGIRNYKSALDTPLRGTHLFLGLLLVLIFLVFIIWTVISATQP
jgi:hypothetical protein